MPPKWGVAPMIVEAYGRSETFLTSGGKAEAPKQLIPSGATLPALLDSEPDARAPWMNVYFCGATVMTSFSLLRTTLNE